MRRSLAFVALVLASTHLHAAPLVDNAGPDRKLSTSARTAAILDQDQAAIAFGSAQHLAVWRDGYAGAPFSIRAARLGVDGVPIDQPALVLAGPSANAWNSPSVTYDGVAYLVTWYDQTAFKLEGRYVSPAGVVSALSFSLAATDPRAVAASDTATRTTLIVSRASNTQLVGRIATGGAAPGAEFTIATIAAGSNLTSPAVTAGPDGFVVAWERTTGAATHIDHALVSLAGAVTQLGTLNTSTTPNTRSTPSIAYGDAGAGGKGYLAVWADSRVAPRRIYGAAIASPPTAIAAGATEFAIESGVATFNSNRPQVAFMGGKFVVVWEKQDASFTSVLRAAHVTLPNVPDNDVTEIFGTQARATPQLPAATRATALDSAGTSGRLVWAVTEGDGRGYSYYDVFTLPIPAGALSAGQTALAAAAGEHAERSVEVASNGAGFMAVWEDTRDGESGRGTELYFQRFDQIGAPVGTPAALLAAVGDQRYPAIAALPGGNYLVAWIDLRRDPPNQATSYPPRYNASVTDPDTQVRFRLHSARVTPDGTVLDVANTAVLATGLPARDRFPRLAADPVNQRWLLTWDVGDDTSSYPQSYAVVVRANGTLGTPLLLDGGVPLASARVCGTNAAWSGGGFYAVAELDCVRYITPSTQRLGANSDVLGFRISYKDALGEELQAVRGTIAGQTERDELAPTVASTGDPADPRVFVVWEDHARTGGVTAPESTLRGVLVAADGTLTARQVSPAGVAATLRWPRLVGTQSGYLLTGVERRTMAADVVAALRLDRDGMPASRDASATATFGTAVSSVPVADPLPLESAYVSTPELPDPLPGAIAVASGGQVLLAYTAYQQPPIGEVHARVLGGRNAGEACVRALNGLGCGDGHCERNSTATDDVGVCCAVTCGGACMRCSATGCDEKPDSDPACGTVSCASLSTECRAYRDAPLRCLSFGECTRSGDLESCTLDLSDPINEGGACEALGCSRGGTCQAGSCVCGDAARDQGERSLLAGCSYGGRGAPGTAAIVIVLGMLWLSLRRRRTALLALALGLIGCTDDGVLAIDLSLDDETGRETAVLRIVIDKQDATAGFAPAAPSNGGRSDLTVRNVDVDGDGVVEIVADLEPSFPLLRSTSYLAIEPTGPAADVVVHAIALNRYGNPIAEQQANARLPGDAISLTLRCTVAGCAAPDDRNLTTPTTQVDAQGKPVAAVAAGRLAGQRVIAAGVPRASDSAAMPSAGRVVLYLPDAQAQPQEIARLLGPSSGDLAGSSLALGPVQQGDALDLVIGAPGANAGAGRVYVLRVPTSALAAPISLDDPSLAAVTIDGAAGDQLGASLALLDHDGDGRFAIVAGAPGDGLGDGRGRVYVIADPAAGLAGATSIIGAAAGDHLGRSVAARGRLVAAGAPGGNALLVFDPATEATAAGGVATRSWTSSERGGLGTAVALADLDADGAPELVGTAPAGGGALFALTVPASPRALTDADLVHAVRGSQTAAQLGAALTAVPSGAGDGLLFTGLPGASGLAYLLRGSAIATAGPSLPLGADSPQRAARIALDATSFSSVAAVELLDAGGAELLLGDASGGLHLFSMGLTR